MQTHIDLTCATTKKKKKEASGTRRTFNSSGNRRHRPKIMRQLYVKNRKPRGKLTKVELLRKSWLVGQKDGYIKENPTAMRE